LADRSSSLPGSLRGTITCPSGTLAGYQTGTKVGIGKASLVLQENNTNLK